MKKNQIENSKKLHQQKEEQLNQEDISDIEKNSKKIDNIKTTLSDIDISADRDDKTDIEWEYDISMNKKQFNKNEEKKNEKIDEGVEEKEKKNDLIDNESDEADNERKKVIRNNKRHKVLKKDKNGFTGSEEEYLNEFKNINIDSDINTESEKNSKAEISTYHQTDDKPKITEKKDDTIKNVEPENIKDLKSIKDEEKFSNEICKEILKKILTTELTSNEIKILPKKSFKLDLFPNLTSSQSLSGSYGSSPDGGVPSREKGILNLGQLSLSDDLSALNDSIMSSYTAFSVFNQTVKDKKKENSLTLYSKKIAPKLIRLIKDEIYLKYPIIYQNIKTPLKNKSKELMISLVLQDTEMLRNNFKCNLTKENISDIIDKKSILKKFEPINKQIRNKDNLTSDNYYDNILNECLVDSAIELINGERLYGENGDPLEWSGRTHELVFKYKPNEPKNLAKFVCNKLLKNLNRRIGLITENYDYMNAEQINNERDKRLNKNLRNELDEDEYEWRNLDMEETQLKVELAELIMEQLYNENIEILEHIQYSRNRPDLYQNKSIYSCEEIPKLSFQKISNELKDKDDLDDLTNI